MNKKIIGLFIMMLFIGTTLNTVGTMNKNITPNDSDFSKQWYLDNTGQTGGTADCDIDAPEAWEIETGDPNVVIAIIDSGVDYTHPDLAGNVWINEDEIPDNGIDDDENGYTDDIIGWDWRNNDNDPLDDLAHGTMCAGIASAVGNNNIGVTGVCWNCKIMPLKITDNTVMQEFNINDFASAIEYAANNGANVISISLETYVDNTNLKNAVEYAYNKGVVLVACAGNYNTSDEYYPASYDQVIAAGGTDHNDNRMNFYVDVWHIWLISNYGSWVDVAAPGHNIFTTFPSYHVTYNDYGAKQNYDYGGGTSAACPIVAGVAALLLSRDPTLTPEEVKTLICENVDPYFSEYYIGTGRINAYKALSALNTPPNKPTINGPSSGKTGEEQEFIILAIDAYEDDISYIIDWGDDSGEETYGPFTSGEEQTVSHVWSEKGDYTIKVKARDIIGAESDWAIFEISMPKNKTIDTPLFLQRFFQRFPVFEKILNQII